MSCNTLKPDGFRIGTREIRRTIETGVAGAREGRPPNRCTVMAARAWKTISNCSCAGGAQHRTQRTCDGRSCAFRTVITGRTFLVGWRVRCVSTIAEVARRTGPRHSQKSPRTTVIAFGTGLALGGTADTVFEAKDAIREENGRPARTIGTKRTDHKYRSIGSGAMEPRRTGGAHFETFLGTVCINGTYGRGNDAGRAVRSLWTYVAAFRVGTGCRRATCADIPAITVQCPRTVSSA